MNNNEQKTEKTKLLMDMKESLLSAFNDADARRQHHLSSPEAAAGFTQGMAQVGKLILEIEDRLEGTGKKSIPLVARYDKRPE